VLKTNILEHTFCVKVFKLSKIPVQWRLQSLLFWAGFVICNYAA
jgi:hypothetical protein